MKIAILTLRGEFNYGNLLQTYALQQTLVNMGHSVTILNRRSDYPTWNLFILRLCSIIKGCFLRYVLFKKDVLIHKPWVEVYIARKGDVRDNECLLYFADRFLHLSPVLRSSKELYLFTQHEQFDAYVVGSDQVWREEYTPNIEDYFLSFLSSSDRSYKVAYAASFGTIDHPISAERIAKCIAGLKRFDAISVREQEAVSYMHKVFGEVPKWVLDPTLLLNISDYELLIENDDKNVDAGIVTYFLDETVVKQEIAKCCGEILDKPQTALMKGLREDGFRYLSISYWLSAFKNATFVVTDSFHGCVFAIIFRKPFVVYANAERGIDRFTSVLNMLGLQEHLVWSREDFLERKDSLLRKVDYGPIIEALESMKKESLGFLLSSLKDRYVEGEKMLYK